MTVPSTQCVLNNNSLSNSAGVLLGVANVHNSTLGMVVCPVLSQSTRREQAPRNLITTIAVDPVTAGQCHDVKKMPWNVQSDKGLSHSFTEDVLCDPEQIQTSLSSSYAVQITR
ncbi:hypothetical protein MUG91_G6n503 [Manis pentadactyla]|nr:hypothetical protein MUG91_G6n503 [Manis pentadactyla]